MCIRDRVVIAPLVNAHLLADQVGQRRQTILQVPALAEQIDRNRCFMALRHGGNDVLRAEGRITTEKHLRQGRLQRRLVQHRHIPLVKLQPDVLLDPGKGIFLADGHQHLVAFHEHIRLAGRNQAAPAPAVILGAHEFEEDAIQLSFIMDKLFRHVHVDDRNIFCLLYTSRCV